MGREFNTEEEKKFKKKKSLVREHKKKNQCFLILFPLLWVWRIRRIYSYYKHFPKGLYIAELSMTLYFKDLKILFKRESFIVND